ncbi:hypothetical protein ACFCXR_00170 [Streptomyces noursei]|uniref:hypothetical protein n=1 Tax=Streptomyces noursei TaxID=1971 RepID=UPI0035D6E4F5
MLLPVVLSATFVQLLSVNRADRRSGHSVRPGRGPGVMQLIQAGHTLVGGALGKAKPAGAVWSLPAALSRGCCFSAGTVLGDGLREGA